MWIQQQNQWCAQCSDKAYLDKLSIMLPLLKLQLQLLLRLLITKEYKSRVIPELQYYGGGL